MLLYETLAPGLQSNPKRQFNWNMCDHLAAEGFPHRSCISIAGIPDVKGLVRSELMVVTGMMISAMRGIGNKDVIVPVGCTLLPLNVTTEANQSQQQLVLVSVLGRYARVIQAHVSLEEQRLKVRYSQLYDFDNCTQRQMDLFIRWILSSPLVEPKLQSEAVELPSSPSGDTTSQTTISKVCNKDYKGKSLNFGLHAAIAVG